MSRATLLLAPLLFTVACSSPAPQASADVTDSGTVTTASYSPPAAEPVMPVIMAGEQIALRVVKSPTCGCCTAWVDYMKQNGFAVTVEDREVFTELKRANGVTPALESCHTAFVGDLVIEGHVPAELVKKVLREKPAGVHGIAVPGMPVGSPGMEGGTPQRYTVFTFDAKGTAAVYSKQ